MKTICRVTLLGLLLGATVGMHAEERYETREGHIWFFTRSPVEEIEVHSHQAQAILDGRNGAVEVLVPIRSFAFSTALMTRHFNESYLESGTYPESVFRGQIVDFQAHRLTQQGIYPVRVQGRLTMHGITRDLTTEGQITVQGRTITAATHFSILAEDFGVEVPPVVRDEPVKIHVVVRLKLDTGHP